MASTKHGLFDREILDVTECLSMLSSAGLARVLISIRCLPAALPVFTHLAERVIMIASAEPAVIEAAQRGDVLAVQVDGAESDGATWSVQVTGAAHLGTADDAPSRERAPHVVGALDDGATLVIVPLTLVTGERTCWSFPR